jgi:hypothetical protein
MKCKYEKNIIHDCEIPDYKEVEKWFYESFIKYIPNKHDPVANKLYHKMLKNIENKTK